MGSPLWQRGVRGDFIKIFDSIGVRLTNETICGRLRKIMKNLSRAVSRAYSYLRHSLSVCVMHGRNAVLLAALLTRRINKTIWGCLRTIMKYLSRSVSKGYPYYRHSFPVRIMHWSNVVLLAILLMSGLNIYDAHPALYWGKSSYNGVPPVLVLRGQENDKGEISGLTYILGYEFNTTGFLGASRNSAGKLTQRSFPPWVTIPDARWLSMARRWHFFFAWLLVVNGITFVTYSIVSRHLHGDLVPTGQDWRSIGKSMIDHLRFRHPTDEAAKRYNVLQKFAYLGVIFFLLPLMILMGLGMSPALDALFPGWVGIFFGRQSIRTIHFVVAWALVLFVIIHVFEVIVSGFWNNLRSMITGYYRVESEADHE
jgi:thiosulfate reductase cytochrome b subunit